MFTIPTGVLGQNTPSVQRQLNAGNPNHQTTGSNANLYESFTNWQTASQLAAEENTLISLDDGTFDDFNEAFDSAIADIPAFSINEDGKTYSEQVETLAKQHLEAYDTIEADGKISLEEFAKKEVDEYNAAFGEESGEISIEDDSVLEIFKSGFDFMDLNSDGAIDENEIKAYYVTADILDGAGNSDNGADGNIQFSSVYKMSEILSVEGEEGSVEAENRTVLRNAMTEIYGMYAGVEPASVVEPDDENVPDGGVQPASLPENNVKEYVYPTECAEPTTKGRAILFIEENFLF